MQENPQKKIVRFIHATSPYGIGDIAGFSEERADSYVKHGRAVYCADLMVLDGAGEMIVQQSDPTTPNKRKTRNRMMTTDTNPED